MCFSASKRRLVQNMCKTKYSQEMSLWESWPSRYRERTYGFYSYVEEDVMGGAKWKKLMLKHQYKSAVTSSWQDAKKKIEKIEKVLQESETGHDLRSSRDLLKQHRQLENETRELAEKMNSIVSHARKMATNHFNSQRILDETQKYLKRWAVTLFLSPPYMTSNIFWFTSQKSCLLTHLNLYCWTLLLSAALLP